MILGRDHHAQVQAETRDIRKRVRRVDREGRQHRKHVARKVMIQPASFCLEQRMIGQYFNSLRCQFRQQVFL